MRAKTPIFDSPDAAEAAFYSAFDDRDVNAMMAVWADDDEIVCIHPHGNRLTGQGPVRAAWEQLFTQGSRLRFELTERHLFRGAMLAVHMVTERVEVVGQNQFAEVLATNVYLQTDEGWRMIVHHASPAPATGMAEPEMVEPEDVDDSRTLH